MKLLPKQEILNYLEEYGANESELCEICGTDMNYFSIYPNIQSDFDLDINYLGKMIVKCQDGFIELPIEDYDVHNGFEQFDLDSVKSISNETVQEYYNAFVKKTALIKEILSN